MCLFFFLCGRVLAHLWYTPIFLVTKGFVVLKRGNVFQPTHGTRAFVNSFGSCCCKQTQPVLRTNRKMDGQSTYELHPWVGCFVVVVLLFLTIYIVTFSIVKKRTIILIIFWSHHLELSCSTCRILSNLILH